MQMGSLRDEFEKAAHQARGSFKTRDQRKLILLRFAAWLRAANVQIRAIDQIKAKYVIAYVDARLEERISKRTLQNELAAIRSALIWAGRERLAASSLISNSALGIDGASRAGTKEALPADVLDEKLAALETMDRGVWAIAHLELALGLRAEEAVKACKSLRAWLAQLEKGQSIRVIYGTKGGRPRDVNPPDRDRAKRSIQRALAVAATRRGFLIDRPSEKSAMYFYSRTMRSAGFKGRHSGHALRYGFSTARVDAYVAVGYSMRDALAMTACDLGHGDGRGRYIAHVYARKAPPKE